MIGVLLAFVFFPYGLSGSDSDRELGELMSGIGIALINIGAIVFIVSSLFHWKEYMSGRFGVEKAIAVAQVVAAFVFIVVSSLVFIILNFFK